MIATYNQAAYLDAGIQSVLNQSYGNVELIVVDDGSTDATPEVAARYSGRIRYIRQANTERGAARNRGLAECKGEFVAFLDGDDEFQPEKIERDVVRFGEATNAGVVYSDYVGIDADGSTLRTVKRTGHEGRVTRQLLESNFVFIGASLIRTELARQIGGFVEDCALSGSEDRVFWVHLSTITDFAYLPLATARKRRHPHNTMSNPRVMERSMAAATRIFETADWLTSDDRRALPALRANTSLVNAINFCVAGERPETWKYLASAVRDRRGIVLDWRFGYTVLRACLPRSWVRAISARRERNRR